MPKIEITNPVGELPSLDDRSLPANASANAINVRFDRGRVEPLGAPDAINLGGNAIWSDAKSIFKYEDTHWFSWPVYVTPVLSPINNDQYKRVYFSDQFGPRVTSNTIGLGGGTKPSASYKLGVPAPNSAPSGTVSHDTNAPADDTSDDETRYYVVTYVSGFGEEGGPSLPSIPFELKSPNDTVSISLPMPSVNQHNITHKRIYRSNTAQDTEYQFVAEVPISDGSFTDSVSSSALGRVLDTQGFLPPPDDLTGLVKMANGCVAGFNGNQVCISEPGLPYAYPEEYRHTFPHEVVALAPTRSGLIVLTTGRPSILSGGHPGSMSEELIEKNQACVSARSVVDMGDYVIYASPDGLVGIGEGGAELITGQGMTKRFWNLEYAPSTIHAYYDEGRYVAFYGGVAGFIFDPESKTFVRINDHYDAGYNDLEEDVLYLLKNGQIHKWNQLLAGLNPGVWTSKVFDLPETAFNCVRIDGATAEMAEVAIWVDNDLIMQGQNVRIGRTTKLPAIKGKEWQVQISSVGSWTRVCLATDMREL